MGCVSRVNPLVVPLFNRTSEIFSIELQQLIFRSFVVETWLAGLAFQRVKKIRPLSEATPKSTQNNCYTRWGRKVLQKRQQRRQTTCAMLEVVGVADLKCEDVQDLTVPVEHLSQNTLNFRMIKFVVRWPNKMESVILPIPFTC